MSEHQWRETTYEYDGKGRQVSRSYNVFGSPVYEKAVEKNGEHPIVTTYRYDSIGRLIRAICEGHSYEYEYDAYGWLKEKRSGGKRLISYEYDKAGQITGMTDPQGMTTRYEYDLLGRTSRTYSDAGMEIRYHYDCLNRLERIRYGNGVVTCYQYDENGNVKYLETRKGEDVLLAFAYEYDGNGNRTRKQGEQWLGDISHPSEITYRYNVRGQLLEERRSGKQEEVTGYHYDAAGNRVRKEHTEGDIYYGYNEKNQLICEEGVRGRTVFTYSHQGSILSEEGSDGNREFAYNSKNQQVKVKCQNGQIQENRYDAEGLQYEMKENEKLLRFVYHRGELLHEGGKGEKSYHLGYGIEAVSGGGEISYYHRDEQLSTALMTGGAGDVRNYYQYDAFGALLEAGEKAGNRIRYTGQQYDGVAEQYYLRARYYNPTLGRFMQEDVYRGDGLNLYAYCQNNPVNYYDPSGYMSLCPDGKFAPADEELLGLPDPGETTSRRALAEQKLAEAAAGLNVGKTIDPLTGFEVGTMYGDTKGNVMISPVGGGINPIGVGYKGGGMETTYPNGSSYQRNNPNGHATSPGQNHGHGHLMGTGPGSKGSGPSIDVTGKVVPYNSPAAHWDTKN